MSEQLTMRRELSKGGCKYVCLLLVLFLLCSLYLTYLSEKRASDNTNKISYNVLNYPLKDTLKKVNKLPKKSKIQREKNSTSGQFGHGSKPAVVLQIDKRILFMIEEIEKRDLTPKGPIITTGVGNYTCTKRNGKKNNVEDILCMPPPKFLPEFKNPCWVDKKDMFQCLPYFQIIGMDKCGSTDLFDKIAQHPHVLKNSGVLHKETMWWSWKRYGHFLLAPAKIENFTRYLKYFSGAAEKIKSKPRTGLITGDGTPMDMWDMSGWVSIPQNTGKKEPTFITPHLIKHLNPNVKLIIILRNPVDRLYSDYFFLKIGKLTPQAFHDHVIRSLKILYACTRQKSLRTCLYSRETHLKSRARLHLGFYSIFVQDWLKVFNRNQLLILRTEDYSKEPKRTIQNVFSFLKLQNLSEKGLATITSGKRKYVTAAKKNAGKMLNETRVILERLYKPYKLKLAEILNDKSFSWNTNS
ncbi:hypothetical protein ACF0H5_001430 [Mactra antiquata]